MAFEEGDIVRENHFVVESAGAADAGKVPKLNSDGVLDDTVVPKTTTSTGSADEGKVPMLDADGKLDRSFLEKGLKFGGDGSDGALTISSGTVTLDAGGAAIFVKNYSSISITGTGSLAFSNPHANGTVVVLRCQGNATITSSAVAAIDLRGMGAANGNNPNGLVFGGTMYATNSSGTVGTSGTKPVSPAFYLNSDNFLFALMRRTIAILPGIAGGNGGGGAWGSAGGGGLGGGALYMEVGGAINFTGTINSNGADGGNMTGSGSGRGSGSGGGGSAGKVVILYNILTAISGIVNSFGGKGGDSSISGSASGTAGRGGPGAASQEGDGGGGGNSNGFTTGGVGNLGAGSGGNSGPAGSGSGIGAGPGTTMPATITKNLWLS